MIRDLIGFVLNGSGLTPFESWIAIALSSALLALFVWLIGLGLDHLEDMRQAPAASGEAALGPVGPDGGGSGPLQSDDYLGSKRRHVSALMEPDSFTGPVLVRSRRIH